MEVKQTGCEYVYDEMHTHTLLLYIEIAGCRLSILAENHRLTDKRLEVTREQQKFSEHGSLKSRLQVGTNVNGTNHVDW